MAISVDICNLALGEVRAAFITSADDDTPEARACARFYPMCLQSLLEAHEWSYATTILQLAALATNNRASEWTYAYSLPSDIAIARRLVVATSYVAGLFYPGSYPWDRPFGNEAEFIIEDGTLYSNINPALLEYVRNDLGIGQMPAVFKKALSLDLASYLATYLLNDSKLKGELIQQAEVAKQRAMAADMNRQPRNEYRHWVAPVTGAPFGLEQTGPIAPSVISLPPTLGPGQTTVVYLQSVAASGGTAPYAYSVISGGLPSGLSLNAATGAITGTPAAAASYSFTIRVTDSLGATASQGYTVPITPFVQFVTLPSIVTDGTPIVGETATLGFGAITGDTLGTKQIIDASDTVIATVTSTSYVWTTSGTYRLRVYGLTSGIFAVSSAVSVGAAPVVTLPGTLPGGTAAVAYAQSVAASGGTSPYTYAVISGALPTGVSLNTSIGALTGTPSAAATYAFTIRATDAGGYQGSQAYSVVIAAAVLTLSPSTLPNPVQGTAYSQTITTTGGTSPYTYAVTSGALPTGLSLSSGGAITGTPGSAAVFTFVITATDAAAATGNRSYTVTVQASGTINPGVLTRTSTTGSAPFLWQAAFDATVYAGYTRHVQVATNSGFTTGLVDYYDTIEESDVAGLAQTIDGFSTLSGIMYVRERVERDDGTVSAWSNTISDTISAVATVLSSTAKGAGTTVTGTPALIFTPASGNVQRSVRATNPTSGQKVYEVTLSGSAVGGANVLNIGFVDGSQSSFNTEAGISPDGLPGAGMQIYNNGSGFNGYSLKVGSGTGSTTPLGSYLPQVGDIYTVKVDTSAGTITFYYTRSGSTTLIGSITGVTLSAWYAHLTGWSDSNVLTANFGQSAFARALDSGYTAYG